jgi:RNA methyltransferase, TrmH family
MLSKNQIKEIRSLHLKKFREEKKLFIAEGVKTVAEIVNSRPELILEIYAVNGFNSTDWGKKDLKVTEIDENDLKKISLQTTPNKVLAVCSYKKPAKVSFDFEQHYSFYLDDIRDPGNFGTIVRLAAWFGISKIFCSRQSCDQYNPKVIQASMSGFLNVELVYIDLSELVLLQNIRAVYGAVLKGENLYNSNLRNGLIVIGNEANGINSSNLELLTHKITIPAGGTSGTESLNAAMAASIILSEFYRRSKIE